MIPALIAGAAVLIVVVGWFAFRYLRPTAGAAPKAGMVVFDRSPVSALLLDPTLHVTWVNEAFCGLFGLKQDELMGRELADVIDKELRPLVEAPDAVKASLLEAHGSEAEAAPFGFHLRARDGRRERWVEHTCRRITQKPLSGSRIAYFQDVTPRKDLSPAHQTREIDLHELDQILLTLALKDGDDERDQESVLREVAEMAARAWKRDRWELWLLNDDQSRWTLSHLQYAMQRQREEAKPEISVPQFGPYLRALEHVRVLVTPDVKSQKDGANMLGHGRVRPEAASRLDIPIRVRGKVVGVLAIVHHTARPWTPDETRFAASIGDRMSFIVETRQAGTGEPQIQVPSAFPPAASSNVDGFVHLDENLRFTFFNPAVLQWLEERGVDGATLVGRTLSESMKGIKDRSIVAEVRKAARGGGPATLRRQLERDGPWLDLYVNPSATGVSVTLQNRARRKERDSERSLLDSETRFRSVVESLREGLVITDLNDRIVYVNPRVTDMTGHRPEDLDGKQAQDLLFDTANWTNGEERMAARRERRRTRYDAPLLDKHGNVISVEVISTPLRDADGAVTGVVDAITVVENREGLRTASLAT